MNVAILLLLILLNGLFAMTEIAVVSANRFRLRQRAEAGSKPARRALELASNPNRFLSTVQIGITLVGVFAGAFGGATLARPLAQLMSNIGWLAPYADAAALFLVVLVITYLSLVIGELVPKRIGLNDPEGIATALAGLMHGISVVARPLVWFLGVSTEFLLRLLRVRARPEVMSEEEIDLVIRQGREAGVVEPVEQEIIDNAFWLGEKSVRAIMTPRHRVLSLTADATSADVLALLRKRPHGRYLIYDPETDEVGGYVATPELLERCIAGAPLVTEESIREPLVVPESLPILSMLERFQSSGTHLAVVFDEYGSFEGLVSLSDILEELVGDVLPEDSNERPEIVEQSANRWLVSGRLHIDQFVELLELEGVAELGERRFETVGGLMAERLGRIPAAGDAVEFHGYDLRIEEMAGLRVRRVAVRRG